MSVVSQKCPSQVAGVRVNMQGHFTLRALFATALLILTASQVKSPPWYTPVLAQPSSPVILDQSSANQEQVMRAIKDDEVTQYF